MNEIISITQTSMIHIINLPHFWLSMGFTTALSMFISPLLFDGNMKLAFKAFWAKLIYAAMLLWLNVLQIVDARLNHSDLLTPPIKALSYVVALNVIVITFFWVIGFFLGIFLIKIKYRNKLYKF